MTRNPVLPGIHFDELTVTSLKDFVDGDREEMLFCLVRAMRCCLSRMDQHFCSSFFISTRRKKCVTKKIITFWLRYVINEEIGQHLTELYHRAVKVEVHQVRSISASVLYLRIILRSSNS